MTGKIQRILVVPHTHHDIGYTDVPRSAEAIHRESIRRAVAFTAADAQPGRAQLKWTVEVSRPLVRLIADEPEIVPALLDVAGKGRLAVTGGYLNMTQLVGHDGYDRLFAPVHGLRELGFDVSTVQHGDVNGIGWGVVPAMRRAGLDTLVMALNPDHGRAPFEQPSVFWWEGPDGGRILAVLNFHYGLGNNWGMLDGRAPDVRTVEQLLSRLDARDDYPFDTAVVHCAFDNRTPSPAVADAVDAWNADPDRVPMTIATIDEAVAAYRRGGLDALPSYRGEWADWWAHGHGSSAREVALARQAQRTGRAAQLILAGASLAGLPAGRPVDLNEWYGEPFRSLDERELLEVGERLDDAVALFAEHTWGARESIRSPQSDFTRAHWHAKAGFAYDALESAHELVGQALGRLADPTGPPPAHRWGSPEAVLLVNPSQESRQQLIEVPVDGGSVEVFARLDPFEVGMAPVLQDVAVTEHAGAVTLETSRFRVRVEPASGGIVELSQLPTGRELLDPSAEFPLGAIVDERPAAGSDHPMLRDRKAFHPDFPGPQFERRCAVAAPDDGQVLQRTGDGWTELRWRVRLPGVLVAELRCTFIADDIQVTVTIDKHARFEPESLFVAFPFAARSPQFLLESTDAVFEAETEQLPDTCRDWYSVQHAVGVRDAEGAGVLWGTLDAPLVQVGGFHTGKWARRLDAPNGHVNSWLMNNLYFTNFKAAQQGVDRFRYVLRPVADVTRAAVARFGTDLSRPVLARALRSATRAGTVPQLELEPETLVLSAASPQGDGIVRFKVRSLDHLPTTGRLRWAGRPVEHSFDRRQWHSLDSRTGCELEFDAFGEVSIFVRPNGREAQ